MTTTFPLCDPQISGEKRPKHRRSGADQASRAGGAVDHARGARLHVPYFFEGLESHDRDTCSDCEQKHTESEGVKHASGCREVRSRRAERAGWV